MTFNVLRELNGEYRWRMTDGRGHVIQLDVGNLPGVKVSKAKAAKLDRAVQKSLEARYLEQKSVPVSG